MKARFGDGSHDAQIVYSFPALVWADRQICAFTNQEYVMGQK